MAINWGQVGIATSASSAISGYFSGQASKAMYGAQAYAAEAQVYAMKVQAKQAEAQADMIGLRLQQDYNELAASNAAVMAASGRSFNSATVTNIQASDRAKLNWDLQYNELSGKAGSAGITANAIGKQADAIGYRSAGQQAAWGGVQQGLLSGIQTYSKYAQIG